jgi:hypothetical protein
MQRGRRLNRDIVAPSRGRARGRHIRREGRDEHEQCGNKSTSRGPTSKFHDAILGSSVQRHTPAKLNRSNIALVSARGRLVAGEGPTSAGAYRV